MNNCPFLLGGLGGLGPLMFLGAYLFSSLPRCGQPALSIRDEASPYRAAFPEHVACALVFTCICPPNARPPVELDAWRFEGVTTRSTFPLPPRPDDAGQRIYAQAVWVSPRGQLGPRSEPLLLSPGLAVAA